LRAASFFFDIASIRPIDARAALRWVDRALARRSYLVGDARERSVIGIEKAFVAGDQKPALPGLGILQSPEYLLDFADDSMREVDPPPAFDQRIDMSDRHDGDCGEKQQRASQSGREQVFFQLPRHSANNSLARAPCLRALSSGEPSTGYRLRSTNPCLEGVARQCVAYTTSNAGPCRTNTMANTPIAGSGVRATGSCLCGAVRFEVVGTLRDVVECHCAMCRKTHGHIGAYTATRRTDFDRRSGASNGIDRPRRRDAVSAVNAAGRCSSSR
jgi:hypothetical protein